MQSTTRPPSVNTLHQLNQRLIACRLCPRPVAYREQVAREKKRMYRDDEYWGKPVPGWGDPAARVYIVGLAPAAHGGNRTGRVFTRALRAYNARKFTTNLSFHVNLLCSFEAMKRIEETNRS
jgi:uracil-DNA glycosylase